MASKLKLNADKTQAVCIQTNQKKKSKVFQKPDLFIEETKIETAEVADFLGVRLGENLGWSEQLSKIEGKLAKGMFVVRSLKKLNDNHLLKSIYHCLLESHISYSVILWGAIQSNLDPILVWQKKAIRCIFDLPPLTHCRPYFKELNILTVTSLYILKIATYIKQHTLEYKNLNHNYNTRHKDNFAETHRLKLYETKPYYIGQKIYQALPKRISSEQKIVKFKSELKHYLIQNSFYTLAEFFEKNK